MAWKHQQSAAARRPSRVNSQPKLRVPSLFWTCLACGSPIFPVRVNPFSL